MNITIRTAEMDDLSAIIRLIADDYLGEQREDFSEPLKACYVDAFRAIDSDPNNELIVAELCESQHVSNGETLNETNGDGSIIGTLQLTFTPSLSFQGGRRCTVESVRVDERFRGQGLGREMMLWAIERAKERGCISMQLTTHQTRKAAHRFYENLGFTASHVGMKLKLK